MSKVSWHDLTANEQQYFIEVVSNGCGGDGWQNYLLEKYYYGKLMRAHCFRHDFAYRRGGGVWEFLESNWVMFAYSLMDAWGQKSIGLGLASGLYYCAVSSVGVLYFKWGRYRTKEEIMEIDPYSVKCK